MNIHPHFDINETTTTIVAVLPAPSGTRLVTKDGGWIPVLGWAVRSDGYALPLMDSGSSNGTLSAEDDFRGDLQVPGYLWPGEELAA